MNKKYFPLLVLLAAALLFFWVKKNQRGGGNKNNYNRVETGTGTYQKLNRGIKNIVYSKHARCRMDCRFIDESEVKEILQDGVLNEDKIQVSAQGKSYPLEGRTHDGQRVRIVFAPQGEKLVVVTVIDLEKDYKCDCY